MNNTAGPSGLVPTLLVFEVVPRTPVAPVPLPAQRERLAAMLTARKEMLRHAAKERVRVALNTRVPIAADRMVHPGQEVLVYREPPADRWEGPYAVVSQEGKVVWLAVDGHMVQFAIDKIKAYVTPAPTPDATTGARRPDAGAAEGCGSLPMPTQQPKPTATTASTAPTRKPPHAVTFDPRTVIIDTPPDASTPMPPAGNPDHGAVLDAVIAGEAFVNQIRPGCRAYVSRHGKSPSIAKADPREATGPRDASAKRPLPVGAHARRPPQTIHLTTVIPPGDPRLKTARFEEAARKETAGLQDRGTFSAVLEGDLPPSANVIGGRFVYTLKNVGTKEELAKARFVAQGHRDQAKLFVVHNLATMRQRSTRLLVSTAAVHGWRLFAHDITQAYLQSKDKFDRVLYLRPRVADRHLFNLAEGELLRVDLPLYGVCDAGDYWHATFYDHIHNDLLMIPLISDPALHAKWLPDGTLSGLLGPYVDDCLMRGDTAFAELTKTMLVRFQSKERVLDNTEFVGVRISTERGPHPHFIIDQTAYAGNLRLLPEGATFRQFASARASAAWLVHTRPDLCCGVNLASQVTEPMYGPDSIRALNAVIAKAKKGRATTLVYPKLDRLTLRLHAYSDASFATSLDKSSQVGFIILLCDASGRAHVLSFRSKKSRRVVQSIMAGEVYAFSAAFDEAYTLRYDLEQLYGRPIPISVFTDSKQLFDVVTKASHPTEKRLLIDIAAARQSYNRGELANVGLVLSGNNIADALTKVSGCNALDALLRTGVDRTPVEQWIIRPALDPPCATTGVPGV
eukprot:TRINITY_DN552_c0_g1_i1.p1 TRINITY_DN552_c0_g1~~TRINITY_DN552_c0_g1_i1.p1  ORF type:complete len:862 (-),score=144.43 TRINITY_DN552_c0_g1_i1:471-2858(-)